MEALVRYCAERGPKMNDADHRQARVLRSYLIASLLNVQPTDTMTFTNEHGTMYRVASYR